MNNDKFFWIPVKNTKAIVFFWLVLATATHVLYLTNLPDSTEQPTPEAAYYEQLAISTRQLFFMVLFVYSAIRVILPSLSFWTRVKDLLGMWREHPLAASVVILGLCVILAGAIVGGGSALVKSY